jgi:predicted N-formylglutamate amidohydrolase
MTSTPGSSLRSSPFESIPGVVEVTRVGDGPAQLLLEVPHGATLRTHFDQLRAQLKGPFPDDLVDFFFVNTDVGAPEVALACAKSFGSAVVLRCSIPRTFIDTNRVIDATTKPSASTATGMTPGVVRYVTDGDDLALLFARYSAYRACVERALTEVCGAGGTALMVHSYAPRSVDVPVDEKIVERLRAAYAPDVEPTWPLRPDVDLITRTPDGELFADEALIAAAKDELSRRGLRVAENETYPLHPSSLAHVFAQTWPKQTLCLELRRDLLVDRFTPFQEMRGDQAKCDALGACLARAIQRWRVSR